MQTELRWAVPEHTATEAPRLQYRVTGPCVAAELTQWRDVPWAVLTKKEWDRTTAAGVAPARPTQPEQPK